MKQTEGLEKQQQLLDGNTPNYKIPMAIGLAFERTSCVPKDGEVNRITQDVAQEFKDYDEEYILKGIRAGALGEFGKTYRMSTQEVCIWIRTYIKNYVDRT